VSVIYSGGDDLFIVGAWNETIELANDIAASFKKYSAGNPDISISGGFITANYNFPLYQLARLCHAALEEAKHNTIACLGQQCSKLAKDCPIFNNKLCLRKTSGLMFYNANRSAIVSNHNKKTLILSEKITLAYQWEDILEYIVPMVKLFRQLGNDQQDRLEIQGLSRGFIRRLFSIVDIWEKDGVLYYPIMHYVVTKMKTIMRDALADPVKKEAIEELLGPPTPEGGIRLLNEKIIRYSWTALTWVDFLMREEQAG